MRCRASSVRRVIVNLSVSLRWDDLKDGDEKREDNEDPDDPDDPDEKREDNEDPDDPDDSRHWREAVSLKELCQQEIQYNACVWDNVEALEFEHSLLRRGSVQYVWEQEIAFFLTLLPHMKKIKKLVLATVLGYEEKCSKTEEEWSRRTLC